MPSTRSGILSWLSTAAELAILFTCLGYLITGALPVLVAWEIVSALYLSIGLAVVWRGRPGPRLSRSEVQTLATWMWLPPVIAGAIGANAAILALVARGTADGDQHASLLMVAGIAGIVLSWALLQVGFADVYQTLDRLREEPQIRFPGTEHPATLDYLYIAFTIGTSFATSDAEILTRRLRRVVLLHSIVSFFYNALVVAVAFQLLQELLVP